MTFTGNRRHHQKYMPHQPNYTFELNYTLFPVIALAPAQIIVLHAQLAHDCRNAD